MSQVTKTFTEHPQNSITLMNGAVLECFPKESHQGDFVPDQMKLDTTGVYLSIGNKQIKDLVFKVSKKNMSSSIISSKRYKLQRDGKIYE